VYDAPGVFGGVTNWTVAGAGGSKKSTRGMVTRTYGAPADQVNVPMPSSRTSVAVVVMVGASTRKDPKYDSVPPLT
jgi:hypothetical protein